MDAPLGYMHCATEYNRIPLADTRQSKAQGHEKRGYPEAARFDMFSSDLACSHLFGGGLPGIPSVHRYRQKAHHRNRTNGRSMSLQTNPFRAGRYLCSSA